MSFPLAHPAAVLPFRRWCPGFLSFPALVVGSLTPDASYLLGPLSLGTLGHQMVGIPLFCLPVGWVALVILHRFGVWVSPRLPTWLSQPLGPFCDSPLGSPLSLGLSILIGATTHVLWDSFSHADGWVVLHWPLLHTQIATLFGVRVRVCHLLWYGSTPLGVFCLAVAGQRWLYSLGPNSAHSPRAQVYRNATFCAALMVPLSLMHHLLHGLLNQIAVLVFLVLLMLGFLFWIRSPNQAPT